MSFQLLAQIIGFISNILEGAAAILVLYLYFFKGSELKQAVRVLINYSFQTTLNELQQKLQRLNDYNANNAEHLPEVKNIFHEIAGQIRGNSRLNKRAPQLADKFLKAVESRKFAEPMKRSLVSEVREILRDIHVESAEKYAKGDK